MTALLITLAGMAKIATWAGPAIALGLWLSHRLDDRQATDG